MNKEFAKYMILGYLSKEQTLEGVSEAYAIQNGDDEVLLKHIKAIYNIFGKAIEEMESEEE